MNYRVKTCGIMVLFLILMISPLANAATEPDRNVFSVGLQRIEDRIAYGQPLTFLTNADASNLESIEKYKREALTEIVNSLMLSGVLQCSNDSSGIDFRLLENEKETSVFSQRAQGNTVTVCMNDTAFAGTAEELECISPLCEALTEMKYESLLNRTDIFDIVHEKTKKLWALASPYARDNNNLSVGSGATSHGITYEIDDDAFHNVMMQWLEMLKGEITEELYNKILDFSNNATVPKKLVFNLAYGEADVLRSAKGSGTISYNGKKATLSIRYSCSLSSTRITKKWRLSYEPAVGDTISLNLTMLTSCSGNGRAASETDFSVSGRWNDKAYKLQYKTSFLNRYELDASGLLSELLTGTLEAGCRYGGETLLKLKFKRNGTVCSSTHEANAEEIWTGNILIGEDNLFEGNITMRYAIDPEAELLELPNAVAVTSSEKEEFEHAIECWQEEEKNFRVSFLDNMTEETMQKVLQSY